MSIVKCVLKLVVYKGEYMGNVNRDKIINYFHDLSENATIIKYISEICDEIFFDEYYEQYRKNIEVLSDNMCPFLTILIRTQGKREDGLREALLCVFAQTFTNYEVIIIGHKADSNGKQLIRDILEDQQEEFREKIRYVELDGGTRTVPLNLGFSLAKGKYISVFDDDDILFDNWAESFYKGFIKFDGQILHSYAFAQKWKKTENIGYRAESKPIPDYCERFNLVKQLTINKCPLMTLAFPTKMFQKYGVTFNEHLNVMEDWEYFMRLAYIIGVGDIEEPTAIYRFWTNAESSATLHSQEEWDKTFAYVQERISQHGLYFPQGYANDIIKNITNGYANSMSISQIKKSELYYSIGEPFTNLLKIIANNLENYPKFNYWFPLKMESSSITAMRFDFGKESLFILKQLDIEIYFTNGEFKVIPLKDCVHTGIKVGSNILFVFRYPEIVWEFQDNRYIDCVHISGEITKEIPRGKILDRIIAVQNLSRKRKLHSRGWF